MNRPRNLLAMILGLAALVAVPAAAQTPLPRPLTDAECKVVRDRLAEHAKLSDGVRRAVAGRAAAAPAAATPSPAPAPGAAPAGRAGEIRARLDRIKIERQQADDGRIGALSRFDLGRVAQYQSQLMALEQERGQLERELVALPATSEPAPPPAAVVWPPRDVDRIRCQDVTAAYDEAVRTRQRELGAREGQPGVVPLIPPPGPTPADVARDLAVQMPEGAGAQLGLLDAAGSGRIEAFIDTPVPGVYRRYRARPDGKVGVESFAAPPAGAAYGEIPRRIDEAGAQHTGRGLADLLAVRPAGPVRVTAETPDWALAWAQWQAGSYADAARLERPALRSLEYQNFRGEAVRVVEVLASTGAGVALRRLVAIARGQDRESWEEAVIVVRLLSFTRVEAEVTYAQETRTGAGVLVGARAASGPARFTIER